MRRQSTLQRSYNRARKIKARFCKGKATKAQVKKAVKSYEAKAVAAGQKKTEAKKKGSRILNGGCSMSSSIKGRKIKRKATRKKTTRRRRRK